MYNTPKRNKGNRHPARSFAPKFRRTAELSRQKIRQLLRVSMPMGKGQGAGDDIGNATQNSDTTI